MTQQAVEFTSVTITPNPVNAGNSFIISVGLHDFSHRYWSGFTHEELEPYTHEELGGVRSERVNLYSTDNQDYNSYIRYANQIIGAPCTLISDSATCSNRLAELAITPGKTYIVQGDFDTRFRVATLKSTNCKSQYVCTNYVFDPLDNNDTSVIGSGRELTITAGADHDLLVIGYWTSMGTVPFTTIKNSIRVYEV